MTTDERRRYRDVARDKQHRLRAGEYLVDNNARISEGSCKVDGEWRDGHWVRALVFVSEEEVKA